MVKIGGDSLPLKPSHNYPSLTGTPKIMDLDQKLLIETMQTFANVLDLFLFGGSFLLTIVAVVAIFYI